MCTNKNIKCIAIVALLATIVATASAQEPTKQDYKVAKKQAKEMKKEGWKNNPGGLSLVEQIARSNCTIRNKEIWLTGLGKSTGSIESVVRKEALFDAKIELVKAIIKAAGENISVNDKQGVLTAKTFHEEDKGIYANEIRHPDIITDCYKNEEDGNITVLIRVALSKEESMRSYERMNGLYEKLYKNKKE